MPHVDATYGQSLFVVHVVPLTVQSEVEVSHVSTHSLSAEHVAPVELHVKEHAALPSYTHVDEHPS